MTSKNSNNFYVRDRELPDFRELLDGYLKYWPWFLISVLITLLIGFLYLRFTIPTYAATTSVIIENEEGKGPGGDASNFADLGLLKGLSTSSIENELGLLRSKRLMVNAVKALQLNVLYYDQEGFPKKDIYKGSPYLLRVIRMDESKLSLATRDEKNYFSIDRIDEDNIRLIMPDETQKEYKIGDVVQLDYIDFAIDTNEEYNFEETTEKEGPIGVDIVIYPIESMASRYQGNLGVELVDENSTLINVSTVDEVKQRAEDILNQLIFEYNQEAIEDKNLIARNTAYFIDERLSIINSELDSVESGKEQFKESNRLTDIQAESSLIIQNASEYEKKQQEVNTQLELTNAMMGHLRSNTSSLLPTNLGIDESGTAALIDEFNKLILERNKLLNGATDRNPLVIRLNNQINQIKSNIQASLDQRRLNLRIARDNLNRQAGILGSQISEVPSQERQFRGIERQQNIKEALYLFLLQKREENSLALAVTAPKAKLVDKAFSYGAPVSPNNKIVLAVSFLMGLFFPFVIINAKNLLDNKIRSREDIKKISRELPIVAEIPQVSSREASMLSINERSVLAESFNILSANLNYVMGDGISENVGKCIYVTSTSQGEGKTFSVVNLAMTLVRSGKSVIIIGADLRNPQLQRYENGQVGDKGLSTYLAGSQKPIIDFIEDSKLDSNLKVLPSGPVPPNPTHLLRNPLMGDMFYQLKEVFDYIIVDTAPSMILADTFLISQYADITLYLIRAGKTKRKAIDFALESYSEGKLKNPVFLLNDVKLSNAGYGHKYGYKYGVQDDNSFMSDLTGRIKSIFKRPGA
ncbi:polysaccharide biosynthesis tyrosine autokinase [Cytophaga sp. FL35]|uniref:GumC family protein n=1 Tax=Cytophaga sp. FL35 TaxID=1904456 RepID=UPI001653D714|nr:polysaccharide biosynthesis tyrosine autokinase [Cytophaga sp. FL35]MBC6999410.1 polysaccharide biosynthesis tyrosine autokinase [Cytophaga sp. FL35]